MKKEGKDMRRDEKRVDSHLRIYTTLTPPHDKRKWERRRREGTGVPI